MDIRRPRRLVVRRLAAPAVLAAFLSLVLAAPAAATVTIGSRNVAAPSFTATSCIDSPCAYAQTALPSASVASPVNGTVIRWRAQVSPTGTPTDFGLRVLRPIGGTTLFVASDAETFGTGGIHERTSSLPISIGDRIGIAIFGGGVVRFASNASARGDYFEPSPADGSTVPPTTPFNGVEFLFNADVEPTNAVTVVDTSRNKNKGTATLTVEVPNPGEIALSGKGLKGRAASTTGPGTLELKVKAKGKKLRRLNDEGKAKVKPTVTFTPTHGTAGTQSERLRLRKKG